MPRSGAYHRVFRRIHIADAGKAVEIADRVARAVGAVGADLDGTVHEEREVFLRIQRVEPFALFKLIQRKCEIRGIERDGISCF